VIVDRTDQVWEYFERDRFVIAWVYDRAHEGGHSVTVFVSSKPRIWDLGPQRWAENVFDPWDNDTSFRRLL
jgi:hypothetical protein